MMSDLQFMRMALRLARRGYGRTSPNPMVGAVLVKGGHLPGNDALDILWDGREFTEFRMARVESRHTHGTGCVYSAAITAGLARRFSLVEAVGKAKDFVHAAILSAPWIGGGAGPLGLWAK